MTVFLKQARGKISRMRHVFGGSQAWKQHKDRDDRECNNSVRTKIREAIQDQDAREQVHDLIGYRGAINTSWLDEIIMGSPAPLVRKDRMANVIVQCKRRGRARQSEVLTAMPIAMQLTFQQITQSGVYDFKVSVVDG